MIKTLTSFRHRAALVLSLVLFLCAPVLSRAVNIILMIADGWGYNHIVAGSYQKQWDGRDQIGNQVASGVYFYLLRAGNKTLTQKAVFLK